MFSANQISGFSNQPYLQNKSMNFLHVDSNSHKLKGDQNILSSMWPEMDVASLVTEH